MGSRCFHAYIYVMPDLFSVALFLLVLVAVLGYFALLYFHESDQLGSRLRRVSQMLQKAELDTGVPYFTSLGNYLDVENPTMFLIAKRRAVYPPSPTTDQQEEEEQEEQEEQEAQEEHSESDHPSEEGGDEEAASDTSQILPSPPHEIEYTTVFQPTKED